MKKSINEKYIQVSCARNDIYRKFEKQFRYCFLNPISIESDLYIEHCTNEYNNVFDVFFNARESDVKFFIGYTGVGKSTFIKHYFGYKTLGVFKYNSNSIVIPNSWDGKKIPDVDFSKEIDLQISNVLDNAIKKLYKSYEELIVLESDSIIAFIENNRPDILISLDLDEIQKATRLNCTINQFKLQKSKNRYPIEISCSILKYIIENHNCKNNIERIIFIVDDLETLSQPKLCYIFDSYFKIYACMHNMKVKLITNLLISLRPHSFRFLRKSISHQCISAYGNFLRLETYRLFKNEIPDIREILKSRFENAMNFTPKPGNKKTWDDAKTVFFEIIDDFDDNILNMITELCHMNIRAITDCFQMILSNRVWCQEFDEYDEYPKVDKNDYHFDIVNVVRTLACGENPIYTGQKEVQFNQSNLSNIQSRPILDDSDVFIPNLLVDIETKECDIMAIIIVQYLDGYFSSDSNTFPQTEFITRDDLCNNLIEIFNNNVNKEKISKIIDFLFNNRIIRKSIISTDDDETINKLLKTDHLYLTLKGSRLLSMFKNDSVLLEIFREDIKRNYEDAYYKSSLELIAEGSPGLLFTDLIKLANEIYYSEDKYQSYINKNYNKQLFYEMHFPVTSCILSGIEKSLMRSQNIDPKQRTELNLSVSKLKNNIKERIDELSNG